MKRGDMSLLHFVPFAIPSLRPASHTRSFCSTVQAPASPFNALGRRGYIVFALLSKLSALCRGAYVLALSSVLYALRLKGQEKTSRVGCVSMCFFNRSFHEQIRGGQP